MSTPQDSDPSRPQPIPGSDVPIVIHPEMHGSTEPPPDVSGLPVGDAHARIANPLPDEAMGADRSLESLVATSRGPASAPPELALPEPRRAYGLDALRGLFLLSMTFGFTIAGDFFPAWMYHRQFPPPEKFIEMAGLTWRDLAFGAFIFTMAAALPLSLARRVELGETEFGLVFAAIRRFVMLMVFALLIGHSNTYFTGYTQEARGLAVLGFLIMFLVFVRRRRDWNPGRFKVLNTLGWIAAAAFLFASPMIYGETFSPSRIDDIIAGLAFSALAGSVVWYFTRDNIPARLAVLAVVAAIYLSSRQAGWLQDWWWSSAVPWLGGPHRLTLLTIVIPGTIAGDLLARWMKTDDGIETGNAWGMARVGLLSAIAIAIPVVTVIGLDNRLVATTTQVVFPLIFLGAIGAWQPGSSSEQLLRSLFLWSSIWLGLGILLDPAEGGIHKVPESLSYFFTVTGLSMMLLVPLTVAIDIRKGGRWLQPLVDIGHNPMLCYVLFTVFINSILEMIEPMRTVLRASPGESILRSIVSTILVVLIVQFFTRKRIFWRT